MSWQPAPRREVWITGLGIASPLGVELDVVAEAQREGRSGAGPLSAAFDTRGFEVQAACRVDRWDLAAALGEELAAPLLGREDRKAEFGWYAVNRALWDAFGDEASARQAIARDPRRVAAHFSSGLVSTPLKEAEAELLACLDPDGAFDYEALGRLLQSKSRWRSRHFTDRVNHLLAWRYGLAGPSLVNHGACASASVAIGAAARWIARGRADVALAGGFESMIHPFGVLSFQLLGALSERSDCAPSEVSRPFDRGRDGFVIAEGGAVLVLEEAERARKRGARCYGKVLGLGTSLDAYRVTAPPPDGRGAKLAMQEALMAARIGPREVDYINAHGTSTPLNDSAETQAVREIFGGKGVAPPMSSSKSMCGHAVAAAGSIEAVLTLLALRDGILPPTINLHDPDPECDLDYVPNVARDQTVDVAMCNSFGFGGVNASLILARGEERT